MMSRRDTLEQMASFAYGEMQTNPQAIVGQCLLRKALDMLKQRVERHTRDLDMTEMAAWRKVDGEYSHEVDQRRAYLIAELKLLNELGGKQGRNC